MSEQLFVCVELANLLPRGRLDVVLTPVGSHKNVGQEFCSGTWGPGVPPRPSGELGIVLFICSAPVWASLLRV